jgi:vacuolar protein sorting-associated protein 13A/C
VSFFLSDVPVFIVLISNRITTTQCRHLVIDAGHISIESDLADKDTLIQVQSKRKKEYSDEDYKRLESLMYDKFSLKLEAAQFLLGNDLESCRRALISDNGDSLHLLERTNITLQVQNSIVPKALALARMKVAGNLPQLRLNFSDAKYKTLMKLVDVTIPQFDDPDTLVALNQGSTTGVPQMVTSPRPPAPRAVSGGYQIWDRSVEYNVDTDDEGADDDDDTAQFFDAPSTVPGSSVRFLCDGGRPRC